MHEQSDIKLKGTIVESVSSTQFRVALENGSVTLASLSGEMRLNCTRVLQGDSVVLEFSPYDLSKGRIVRKEEVKQ